MSKGPKANVHVVAGGEELAQRLSQHFTEISVPFLEAYIDAMAVDGKPLDPNRRHECVQAALKNISLSVTTFSSCGRNLTDEGFQMMLADIDRSWAKMRGMLVDSHDLYKAKSAEEAAEKVAKMKANQNKTH